MISTQNLLLCPGHSWLTISWRCFRPLGKPKGLVGLRWWKWPVTEREPWKMGHWSCANSGRCWGFNSYHQPLVCSCQSMAPVECESLSANKEFEQLLASIAVPHDTGIPLEFLAETIRGLKSTTCSHVNHHHGTIIQQPLSINAHYEALFINHHQPINHSSPTINNHWSTNYQPSILDIIDQQPTIHHSSLINQPVLIHLLTIS